MSLDIDLKDLSFIRDVDKTLAEDILTMCKFLVDDTYSAMQNPENVDDLYFRSIPKDKLQVMHTFYASMLEIFLEYEMYENCTRLAEIIEKLEKFKN